MKLTSFTLHIHSSYGLSDTESWNFRALYNLIYYFAMSHLTTGFPDDHSLSLKGTQIIVKNKINIERHHDVLKRTKSKLIETSCVFRHACQSDESQSVFFFAFHLILVFLQKLFSPKTIQITCKDFFI